MTTTSAAPALDDAPPSQALPAAARRRRIGRRVVGGVVLLAVLALTAVLPEPRTSSDPLAPDSTAKNGSRAVAQILARQGVRVQHVSRLADAVEAATAGSTLLVTDHSLLDEEQVERLASSAADLVLIEPDYLVSTYAPQIYAEYSWGEAAQLFAASCSDADAVAAGELSWPGAGFTAESDAVTLCFLNEEGAAGLAVTEADGRRVAALATHEPLTNGALEEGGNAALALRLLGRNANLVWYTPKAADLFSADPGTSRAGAGALVPSWVGFAAVQLTVLVVFVALWRGRRLGRLVAEPLPVVVQSAEVTRGRGRLYRRSRSYGHAAAALRAAAASRCAQRLGLPRSAGAQAVLDELSYASGRSRDEIALLLYGPPPTSDAGLTHLARQLDRLESEVNRP